MTERADGVKKLEEFADGGDIPCFLCDGLGRISKHDLLRKLGVEHLGALAKMGADQALASLDEKGAAFIEQLRSAHEAVLTQRISLAVADERKRAEAATLRAHDLEKEVGRLRGVPGIAGGEGERDFAEFARRFRDLRCGKKLAKHGDYLLSVQTERADGKSEWLDDAVLVDVKNRDLLDDAKVATLARDARTRQKRIAFLVGTDRAQLASRDSLPPLLERDGVIVVRMVMDDFGTYLDLLKPLIRHVAADLDERPAAEWRRKAATLARSAAWAITEVGSLAAQSKRLREVASGLDDLAKRVRDKMGAALET